MTEHPDTLRLDALALGGSDAATVPADARAHVEACAECTRYVEGLRAELGAEAPLRAPVRKPARVIRLVFAAVPALAAAAALLLFLRTPAVVPVPAAPAPASSADVVHFKGGLPMAVVLERAGVQARFTDRVVVRPGDRLRVEVALDVARPTEVALLAADGSFVVLLAPMLLEPGTHYSDQAVRFDEHPSAGWVLAGDPQAIDRARATRDFHEVAALPVAVEVADGAP